MNIDQVLERNLTPEQKNAAMDPASEVLCLACAGSGKSRTLAYRIAYLLARNVTPQSIVAFTFTNKAADSIKRRVSQALQATNLDPSVIGAMYIGTIHAYCQRVLGDIDATYRQYDVLDDNRLQLFLISRYSELGLQDFRGNPQGGGRSRSRRYFDLISEVAHAWKTTNDELLSFTEIAAEDPELGALLQRIQDQLRKDQYLDFSLMIRHVVEAVSNGKPEALKITDSVRHLLVDEYQDVNPCEEQLIRLLRYKAETLFVVGDDDQAIYAWRGSDVSNILEFRDRYPSCSSHTLARNFRSTDPIVQASDAFVAAELGSIRFPKKPLAHANQMPQDCRVLPMFPDRRAEASWVAERIRDLLDTAYQEDSSEEPRGLTPADFAILMRSTRLKEKDGNPCHAAFTEALTDLGIPFSLEAGGAPFERIQTAVLRDTFELMRNTNPSRSKVRRHFEENVLHAFPDANFDALAKVLSNWGRRIHRPMNSPRVRLYPQELMYDLLFAFNLADSGFPDDVMRDIGLFSLMLQDVETVYLSVDSKGRFSSILNFLQNSAEKGYNVSTDDLVQRPDAVTVSTVHKMKGLEFPCVFVVDAEAQRFPLNRRKYSGWLPENVMSSALERGAYHNTHDGEARLFYTAVTRAERYLYISGAVNLPGGTRVNRSSKYSLRLAEHERVACEMDDLSSDLPVADRRRRLEETDYPTSFSEIQYYLQCPRSYQFRERYGFKPIIKEMFGYGKSVHTSIQKLHEIHSDASPTLEQAAQVVQDTFHLKHAPASRNPVAAPGPYERARAQAAEIAQGYVQKFGSDFVRERQIEATFEISAEDCTITGSIDLLLHEDENGSIQEAEVIDFKTMEGGPLPDDNNDLNWTSLALQVQLYAMAAEQVLDQNAKTGSVHFLKDGQRIKIPITPEALAAALRNVEWAVKGILSSDFPMRPHAAKCRQCDFEKLCPKQPQGFQTETCPPPLHLPNCQQQMAHAFSQYDDE